MPTKGDAQTFPMTTLTLAPGWAEANKYTFEPDIHAIIVQMRCVEHVSIPEPFRFSYNRAGHDYMTVSAGGVVTLQAFNVGPETIYFEGPAGRVLEILKQRRP